MVKRDEGRYRLSRGQISSSEVGTAGGLLQGPRLVNDDLGLAAVWGNLKTSISNRSGDVCLDSSDTHKKHNAPCRCPTPRGGVWTDAIKRVNIYCL